MHTPPNDPVPIPAKPFRTENDMAEGAARVLKEQRRQSGGLEDASNEGDARVQDSKPYKNLKSGR